MGSKLYMVQGTSAYQTAVGFWLDIGRRYILAIVLSAFGLTCTVTIALTVSVIVEQSVLEECRNYNGGDRDWWSTTQEQSTTAPSATPTGNYGGLQTARTRKSESCLHVQISYGDMYNRSNTVLGGFDCMGLLALCKSGPICQRDNQVDPTVLCHCRVDLSSVDCCKVNKISTNSNTTSEPQKTNPTWHSQDSTDSNPNPQSITTSTATLLPTGLGLMLTSKTGTHKSGPSQALPGSNTNRKTTTDRELGSTNQPNSTNNVQHNKHTQRTTPLPGYNNTRTILQHTTPWEKTLSTYKPTHSLTNESDQSLSTTQNSINCEHFNSQGKDKICYRVGSYNSNITKQCRIDVPLCSTYNTVCMKTYYTEPFNCWRRIWRCLCDDGVGLVEWCCTS
nr:attachment glycoprotein [Avian metapneumovirus]UWK23282.1 attachment glycoprotein [Avian metapneumovirus]